MKTVVAVIFGGKSSEYGVSLESASAVLTHMDQEQFTPVMIGITKEGQWFHYEGTIKEIVADTWYSESTCTPVAMSLCPEKHEFLVVGEERTIPFDAAFPVLHGKNGEDGTVQGLLELAGVPFVGCKVLAAALCMDKERTHKLVAAEGFRVPMSYVLKVGQYLEEQVEEIGAVLGFPLFVKPVKAGSSYGISKVGKQEELACAIQKALEYDDNVILEENIEGFEVGCAILGTDELVIGEVDEIELSEGFFDFTEKYTLQSSAIHVPARIEEELASEIKQMSARIYKVLGCSGLARVDSFLTPDGEIVFNEVNTLPGFTSHSRYPNMMKKIGLEFEKLISILIKEALVEGNVLCAV